MSTYLIDVVEDADHAEHVAAELREAVAAKDVETALMRQHELDNLTDGTWGAYGTVVVKVCECCGHAERQYDRALWGSVTEATVPGRYTLRDVPNPYLRNVAHDLLTEMLS